MAIAMQLRADPAMTAMQMIAMICLGAALSAFAAGLYAPVLLRRATGARRSPAVSARFAADDASAASDIGERHHRHGRRRHTATSPPPKRR